MSSREQPEQSQQAPSGVRADDDPVVTAMAKFVEHFEEEPEGAGDEMQTIFFREEAGRTEPMSAEERDKVSHASDS